VYNFENDFSINLIELFSKQYPGIILLHDQSLFKLQIGRLAHGSSGVEFERLLKKFYPSSRVNIGEEIVLKKSISIYEHLYTFLNDKVSSRQLYLTFGKLFEKIDGRDFKKVTFNFTDDNRTKELESSKNCLKILCVCSSELSKVGFDLTKLFGSLKKIFILNCQKRDNRWELEMECGVSHSDLFEMIESGAVNAIVEIGNLSFQGLSAFSLSALQKGIPILLEESLESLGLGMDQSQIYEKEDSLIEIVDRLARLQNCKIKKIDFRILVESILEKVEPYKLGLENELRVLTETRRFTVQTILDHHLEVIGHSCKNLRQTEIYQKHKLKNTFNELF